jgi:UDP-glucose 4-epimerase
MSILITGVAGFIGCNLANLFTSRGIRVVGFDNLCRGDRSHIGHLMENELFSFIEVDLSDLNAYRSALKREHSIEEITETWHMAANSDILAGVNDANIDLRDTFMTSFNTLELMKEYKIGILVFASSSAVYGDLGMKKLVEDVGPLFPISNYGAMKLASEAAISASVEGFLTKAFIFRFPNVIGTPATHGVMLDFIRKLKVTPDNLVVLGDGTQQKSYLHVEDLIEAMIYIRENATERLNYFNIGAGDIGISVHSIAEQVVKTVAPNATITYGQGNKGWVGDVPKFRYSIEKLEQLGWFPNRDSVEAVRYAVRQIVEQESSS